MQYAIAALFGLSIGTMFAYTTIPFTRWLPYTASVIILLIAVAAMLFLPGLSDGLGLIVAFTALLAIALCGGYLWREHPGLADSRYWARVGKVVLHSSALRRSHRERMSDEP
ncbi:hypothetical protein BH09ACT1_BH09ACT1_02880 [soil metagenome]